MLFTAYEAPVFQGACFFNCKAMPLTLHFKAPCLTFKKQMCPIFRFGALK